MTLRSPSFRKQLVMECLNSSLQYPSASIDSPSIANGTISASTKSLQIRTSPSYPTASTRPASMSAYGISHSSLEHVGCRDATACLCPLNRQSSSHDQGLT